jgi:hypothetical protein
MKNLPILNEVSLIFVVIEPCYPEVVRSKLLLAQAIEFWY